ncbi:MAG: glutamate-cysteine ligase family protein [Desulfovibrionaceae bacterium]|nr:glutamate-cysteine ligase family protein [Desulfovibrionaceae bacterium]
MNTGSHPGTIRGPGVEIEFMIVDRRSLDPMPIADRLIAAAAGSALPRARVNDMTWSSGPALHVVRLKTNGPAPDLSGLAEKFSGHLARMNSILGFMGARIMPGGAHPWMDPAKQARLWPHQEGDLHAACDRAFDCKTHGWSNVQGVHVSIPFEDDREFAGLHAATRLLLPIMPAVAASSPILEGRSTGLLDGRLEVLRRDRGARVPSMTASLVPEKVFSRRDYERRILKRMYKEIKKQDRDKVLRQESLNFRGAAARFEDKSLEIRMLDAQECPRADLAVAALIVRSLEYLAAETWSGLDEQMAWEDEVLAAMLRDAERDGPGAVIKNPDYLRNLGLPTRRVCTAGEIWLHLAKTCLPTEGFDELWEAPLKRILTDGPLARRILDDLGEGFGPDRLRQTYQRLCDCLEKDEIF